MSLEKLCRLFSFVLGQTEYLTIDKSYCEQVSTLCVFYLDQPGAKPWRLHFRSIRLSEAQPPGTQAVKMLSSPPLPHFQKAFHLWEKFIYTTNFQPSRKKLKKQKTKQNNFKFATFITFSLKAVLFHVPFPFYIMPWAPV